MSVARQCLPWTDCIRGAFTDKECTVLDLAFQALHALSKHDDDVAPFSSKWTSCCYCLPIIWTDQLNYPPPFCNVFKVLLKYVKPSKQLHHCQCCWWQKSETLDHQVGHARIFRKLRGISVHTTVQLRLNHGWACSLHKLCVLMKHQWWV